MTCTTCPRLAGFIDGNKKKFPDFYNGPVPSFGDPTATLLVVGLAPGLKGANRTGRPFTGDFAGDILYGALAKFGWTTGTFDSNGKDDLVLKGVMITNAVRCVPPENKVTPAEIKNCNTLLQKQIAALPHLKTILCLGTVSHQAVLMAMGLKKSAYPFGHGVTHKLPNGLSLIDSYHTSRYNVSTRVLTPDMFDAVVSKI